MPSLWSLLHTPTVELLGWTLLHFVWQGSLVTAVLAGALYLLRSHSPRVRYVVSCAALLGLLALPVGTGVFLSGGGATTASPSGSTAGTVHEAPTADVPSAPVVETAAATVPSWRTRVAVWVQPALPWIVLAWGLGVVVFALRFGGGAWRVRRLRRTSSTVPSEWRDRLQTLADRMGVGASVALRRSDRVDGPLLAGWWRPVVLVPAGFLSGLPTAQVEALLLHELAHVRRHDVLVGRLQAVVETLLFFHPATWWISRQVRQAREACCDDLVVQAGSGRKTYAQALTALAERAVEGPATTQWVPAATDGSLLDRIQRLVVPPKAPSTAGRRLSIVAAALLMVTVPVGLAACASQQSTTETDDSQATVDAEASVEREAPKTPDGPSATDEPQTIVVIQDDSTEHTVRLETEGPVEVDSLTEGVYVFRHGNRVDTVEVPELDGLTDVPHPPVPPDSPKRALRLRFDPDSLERVMEARFTPDSLEQDLRRMERRADSIAQQFAERFSDDWAEHWREVPDSAFVFRFNEFAPEDMSSGLNMDSLHLRLEAMRDSLRPRLEAMEESLRPRLEAMRESLRPRLEAMEDSLRPHLEAMRQQLQRDVPEHLREQARRLREQAEELEERAKEMEEAPETPTADSSASELGGLNEPASDSEHRFVLEDFRVRIDGRTVEDGGMSLRGNSYIWVRGPEAVYVFAAQPFDGAVRAGEFQGRVLFAAVEGHDVAIRSKADRPIYVEEGAPVYAARLPRSETRENWEAGVGDHLSTLHQRFGPIR